MYRAFYESAGGLLTLPLLTMFAFIAVWTVAVVHAVRLRREPARLDALSRLPLDDDSPRNTADQNARTGGPTDV